MLHVQEPINLHNDNRINVLKDLAAAIGDFCYGGHFGGDFCGHWILAQRM